MRVLSGIVGAPLALLAVTFPLDRAQAQEPALATATHLDVIASDGSRVHVGEITGRITLTPATRRAARFGRVHVRAGLEIDAIAGPRAELPAVVVGEIAGVLTIVEHFRDARLVALHRRGRARIARITLAGATLEDVPLEPDAVRIEGALEEERSIGWYDMEEQLRTGRTRLCRRPGRGCLTLTLRGSIPVRVTERRGAWAHVTAESDGVRVDGWTPARSIGAQEPVESWASGRMGAISDGCAYEGEPALVAPGTPVSVRPGGPTWAWIPDTPDSVWVYDAAPGTRWVEVTAARGVQRDYPSSTCSLGWVPREQVTFDHLREGGLSLSRATEGERQVIVVHALPPWLAATELAPGDRLLAVIEQGRRRELHDLDGARGSLGTGGTFVVQRDGVEREVRVPLAPGCEEPGAGQPAACRPR
ncbi:MAG: hypothetical protein OHK0013_02760 [Sandaracinaceae bacterium]